MPDLETMDRYDIVVYWACLGFGPDSEPILSPTPVELLVRWDDSVGETVDQHGRTVNFQASMVADQEVILGSNVMLGTLDDYLGTGTGETEEPVYAVINVNTTSSICGRFLRFESKMTRQGWKPAESVEEE